MAYTFNISGEIGNTISSLDCLSYNPRALRSVDQCIIEMSTLTFIHPTGVVGLLCLLEGLVKLNKPVGIALPTSEAVCDYFSKIRLLDAIKSITPVKGDPKVVARIIPRLTPIIPVSSFSTSNAVEKLAEQIYESMVQIGGLASLVQSCHTVIAELAANVVQHSSAKQGWVLAQRYNYHSGNIIEISVGDSGIGLRRSLRSNPQLVDRITTDIIATREVLNGNISRYNNRTRGNGLFQICAEMQAPDRRFTIRSGKGCGIAYGNGKRIIYEREPIIGVLAEARIPC